MRTGPSYKNREGTRTSVHKSGGDPPGDGPRCPAANSAAPGGALVQLNNFVTILIQLGGKRRSAAIRRYSSSAHEKREQKHHHK